jgi:hypothetical protein
LVVSFCILLSDWLMDTGFWHLIGSISSAVIGVGDIKHLNPLLG